MFWRMIESRSDNDYGQPDSHAGEPFFKWTDILLFPFMLVFAFVFGVILSMFPVLAGIWFLLTTIYSSIRTKIKSAKPPRLFLVCLGILLAVVLALGFFHLDHSTPTSPTHLPRPTGTEAHPSVPAPTSTTTSPHLPTPASSTRSLSILLDDFSPQPYQGESIYFFNRLGGDRGAVKKSILDWGHGQVTTTISSGNSWGGVWMSLNHPIREGLPIDFSAILPPQILPAYQSQITGITAVIVDGTPGRTFKLELKDRGELHWKKEIILNGGPQVVSSDLPVLGNINEHLWVLDHASAGAYVVLESVSFTATTQITDTATAAFVWSYGMLLNNWNPATGLVRDKAKDASGEFDAIQATGSLAAATAVAEQIGVVTHEDAVQIVGKISDTLLLDLPRFHGLWPHWVQVSPAGEMSIVPNTEWSSVDTVIAAVGLLAAQSALGMDTSGTEQMLQAMDWDDLVTQVAFLTDTPTQATGSPMPGMFLVGKVGSLNWLTPESPAKLHRSPIPHRLRPTVQDSLTSWPGYSCRPHLGKIIGGQIGQRTGWRQQTVKSPTALPITRGAVLPNSACSDCLQPKCPAHRWCPGRASTKPLAWEDISRPLVMGQRCSERRWLSRTTQL